jgi:RNA polymerase sigma-70 factor, ECF subfamily
MLLSGVENAVMDSSESAEVAQLIEKARQGDPASRQRLFEMGRSYMGLVARAQVESWLRVKVDASDLVQQTMLEAHRDFGRFEGGSGKEWLGWLRKILSHNMADFVRCYRGTAKRKVGREVPLRNPADTAPFGALEPAAPIATPSQEFLQLDEELRVSVAMDQLPDDYREVILLRNLQRLPFSEVAQRMDRSRPAVQMLWMRAIKRLQQLLSAEQS